MFQIRRIHWYDEILPLPAKDVDALNDVLPSLVQYAWLPVTLAVGGVYSLITDADEMVLQELEFVICKV